MPYLLQPLPSQPNITIIGCGGTGGFVAEGLCRLFTGREVNIILVDHDRIEPHNLLRQNFHRSDVGNFKSQVLAERLSSVYQRPIGYSVHPFRQKEGLYWNAACGYPGISRYSRPLLIGCVDNAPARRAMAESLHGGQSNWLIDAGNGANWGQVLIGNTPRARGLGASFRDNICHRLPAPTLQRPDLLTAVPDTPADLDCAAALDLTDQDPTINHMMASIVIQVVRRMAAGACPWMALHIDMDQGDLTPTYATPEAVARITGVPVQTLVYDPKNSDSESPGQHWEDFPGADEEYDEEYEE